MNQHTRQVSTRQRLAKTHCLRAWVLIAVIASLAISVAATAQVTVVPTKQLTVLQPIALPKPIVYAAKFVCGAQTQAAIQIGQTVAFADLEPGAYATALNIFSLSQGQPQIDVYASVHGSAFDPLVAQFSSPRAFETHTVVCNDIMQVVPPNPRGTGEVVEGFLYITRRQPDLDVQAVYTYANREKFEFDKWRGVTSDGYVVPVPEEDIAGDLISIGGAGGGGLGLGASIDVERIAPIDRSGLTTSP